MAMEYFQQGYNCTQSVVLAFQDMLPFDQETILRMVSPFGGGMSRLREVCGSVSGMFFVAGYLYGYDDPKNYEAKKELYGKMQDLAHRFEEENGSIICRELLGLDCMHDSSTPEKRSAEYYKKRPCKELAGCAAELMEQFIQENPR